MTAFEALHPSLQYHLVNSLGWRSLRPLQQVSIPPLLAADHGLLLAPTAGGKTEAAALPLLSRMLSEPWRGLAVLYICPLRALLNNLAPRLEHYAGLLGRRVGVWHGDVPASHKNALRRQPPDWLLTTPESLEGMLVSTRHDPHSWFADLQAVVVDEIHAFAGDDRGWHLLALLGRIQRLAGRELQRVGLSATVGNPEALLAWLTAGCQRPRHVIQTASTTFRSDTFSSDTSASERVATDVQLTPDIQLDWVASLDNAARVIAALHHGEKRLAFCDSRARTEQLAQLLRQQGVRTFVSHSSLGAELRRTSEADFSQATSGVMVATSTLELGIDLGDLDRVIQIDAPGRVASFLQRLGRTGRRPGSRANCLFLATQPQAFLRAAGVLTLWAEGFVEPVQPPAEPFHVLAQQLMALCLQESGVAADRWADWLLPMPGFSGLDADDVERLLHFLLEQQILWQDGGCLWLGAESERRYQRRNFLELLSLITDSPLFTVLHGRRQLGAVDQTSFLLRQDGPPILLLAGLSWEVTEIDWPRRRCWVRKAQDRGRSRWLGSGQALSFELCQAIRHVLQDRVTPSGLTRRGQEQLRELQHQHAWLPAETTSVWRPTNDNPGDQPEQTWWTYAGLLGNATLVGLLRSVLPTTPKFDNFSITFSTSTAQRVRQSLSTPEFELPPQIMPELDDKAIEALKFGDCLPPDLARKVVAARWSDRRAVEAVLSGPGVLSVT